MCSGERQDEQEKRKLEERERTHDAKAGPRLRRSQKGFPLARKESPTASRMQGGKEGEAGWGRGKPKDEGIPT